MKKEMKKNAAVDVRNETVRERLLWAARNSAEEVLGRFGTTQEGLTEERIALSRETYGENTVSQGRKNSIFKRIFAAFVNPFTAILAALALVSAVTDIIMAAPGERNYVTVAVIAAMVLVSGGLRFIQETRSGNAAAKLSQMIRTTACVERAGIGKTEIALEELVAGDIVWLSAGDIVPADVRILSAKDFFVSQSALTGESEPVEKQSACADCGTVAEMPDLAFMGSTVIIGSAKAVVVAVGKDTMLGGTARELTAKPPKTGFEKGVNSVSWLLIRFMLVMVPVVLFLNGFTKGDWPEAVLFAVSVAVGLTPEMLPMIVTANLAKGAVVMGRKKVIIKKLNAIQELGAIDVLCTDKTGTLTQNRVVLEAYLDIHGNEDKRVLRHAFLNSYFQTGLKNLIDLAIIAHQDELGSGELKEKYIKTDEIPFDFNRRRMSVVVADKSGKKQLITKGAVEEMLACCAFAELDGKVVPLGEAERRFVLGKSEELNAKGMRVLAVAQKADPGEGVSVKDESGMVLIGFLAFLDPPKPTAADTIRTLKAYGVDVKILTGDNEKVTQCIAGQVGLEVREVLLGPDLEEMTDEELAHKAEQITVFAKLSPEQKARIVRILRANGHLVGYMGDGINDAAAMKAADVGISVDTAVDIAREAADVILLEKDLNILEDGIVEGRKTYANMIKYIKMTASSNFGNMFSVLAASIFLPFLPMTAIQLILLNMVYDLSCTAIPWDNVDAEFLKKPRKWDASSVGKFMLWIGPTSSVFDITTYLVLYFVVCPMATGGTLFHALSDPSLQAQYIAVFRAGWFIESMWSQTLVIHMIRTPKIPFLQSRASLSVTLLTAFGISVVTALPFTPAGRLLGLAPLPPVYFVCLALTVVCYMALVTAVKKLYTRKYKELL